ncbi:hypothetical protein ES708_00043 [subsurface metagenome]
MKQSPNDIVLIEGNNELNVQLAPVVGNLSGTITDSLDGSIIAGAKVTLGGLVTYSDVNGLYAFYGLAPGSYSGLVEKEHYEPLGFTTHLVLGENFLDLAIDPLLLASVVIGIRTKASNPDLTTPSGSYKSRPTFNGHLVGADYIPNTSFYNNYTLLLPTNPDTDQPWRETDLDEYEFGVWLWASAWTPAEYPDTRCTKVWVVGNYPDGSTKILRPYDGPGWEKVDDVVPDEDVGYIRHTTSGGMIPWSGGFFNFKVK